MLKVCRRLDQMRWYGYSLTSPFATFTVTHSPHNHSHGHAKITELGVDDEDTGMTHDELDDLNQQEFESVTMFLQKQFGDIDVDEKDKTVTIKLDGMEASVDCLKYVGFGDYSAVMKMLYIPNTRPTSFPFVDG